MSRHFLLGQKLFDTRYSDISYYALLLPRQCLLDISSFWQRLLWHLGLDFQNPSLWPLLLGLCYLSLLLSGYYPLIQIATETFATLKTMWHLLLRQKLLLMVMTSSDCSKDKVLSIESKHCINCSQKQLMYHRAAISYILLLCFSCLVFFVLLWFFLVEAAINSQKQLISYTIKH